MYYQQTKIVNHNDLNSKVNQKISYKMLGQQSSLVKYSTPVLVNSAGKTKDAKNTKKQQQLHHTEDILGQILPPKQHRTDNGQIWVQTVLSTPATKIQQLKKRLIQRQARQVGLCPVRQQLYDQCFDETIRQITIDCRQRGLLLVRVRDEYRNQIKAYKNLYESSINHAMRNVIQSDKRKQKMNLEIAKLEKQCSQLDRSVNELQSKIVQNRQAEHAKLKEKQIIHAHKVSQIKAANSKIKTEIQVALEKAK